MSDFIQFPAQQLSFKRKNKQWRKQILDWADSKSFFNYSPVRKSVVHKKINYDLLNGKLHMTDLELVINPEAIQADFIPDRIQHYPILNSKLNLLRGEEFKRVFDYKVVVTDPNSISEVENNKKEQLLQNLQAIVADNAQSEEEFNQELEKINDYYYFEWQDLREIRANALLKHYSKELNFPFIFNSGFWDAMAVGEEIYKVDIVGGEPTLEKLNPSKVRVFKSGYSNKIEDADMIIIEDYWSPGRVIDTYYDVLTSKDMKYIEQIPSNMGQSDTVDSMGNFDERAGFVNNYMIGDEITSQEGFFWDPLGTSDGISNSLLPYDMAGNIRVLQVYWKSRRKIKKVKSYDKLTGEVVYNFYPETYVINKDDGEEEQILWINEAWEGTKIGKDIYVNMRPRVIQYNRLSNPSRCHFGIIGSVYNTADQRPFSLVDMMKPYSYYYDVIHDRLNKLIAKNWGKIITLDLAKVPKGWEIDKWMYYAKANNIAVVDSFKEGNIGAATGKLAGGLNNASSGVIDAELGNSIQMHINLLSFIKGEMAEVAGISPQREGAIENRETVGGVERATLQSSHITEWLFIIHDDVKKRVYEAFLETAKIAMKGRNKKFQYLLSDGTQQITDIDGDEFAESDYGLVVDNSNEIQQLSQKLDTLAQAAMQNGYQLSTIMKMFTSNSLMEKIRILGKEEQQKQQQAQQAQQQQMQIQQQQIEQQAKTEQAKMQQTDIINQRDNETKILVAEINSQAESDRLALMNQDDGIQEMSESERAKIKETARQFDAKLKLDKEKLDFEKSKSQKDQELKLKQINKQNKTQKK